ncbi:MAG: hypothetical protein LUG89_05990 [Methanosphaera sp.]|nr:hypothetical protein [Methanosphaera sp.]
MRKCESCGYENEDEALRCNQCGEPLVDKEELNNIYFPFKNVTLTVILSILGGIIVPLHGLGNAYLGYYKRFLIEAVVDICITICSNLAYANNISVYQYLFIFLLIWWIFTIYDSYNCVKRLNGGELPPKFFGKRIT